MEVHNLATEIELDTNNNIKNVGCLKKTFEQGTREETTLKIQGLENDLIEIGKKTSQMPNEIKKYETDLDRRFDLMDKKIAAMQTELTESKSSRETEHVTLNFEKALAKYIYPPGTPKVHGPKFAMLMEWLEGNKGTKEGQIANNKWKRLKAEFQWSDEHTKVLSTLVQSRKKYPHAELRIPDSYKFTRLEKERAVVIPRMTDRIYELIKEI